MRGKCNVDEAADRNNLLDYILPERRYVLMRPVVALRGEGAKTPPNHGRTGRVKWCMLFAVCKASTPQDRATMISKLLGLPEVKQPKTALLKAKALLKNLDEVSPGGNETPCARWQCCWRLNAPFCHRRSDCLCENDTAWKKIIQLSLKVGRCQL